MSFDKDIAVFQSAFHLIEKTKGKIGNVKKNQDGDIRKILRDSGNEIIRGLRRDNSEDDKYKAKFRLLSVVIALALKDDQSDVTDFWFPLINGLPSLSKDIMFDFIKDCNLSQQFFHLLNHVKPDLVHELLTDLASYIEQDTDEQDRHLLVVVCEYLFLVENPYIFNAEYKSTESTGSFLTSDQIEMCDEINKLHVIKKGKPGNKDEGSGIVKGKNAFISRLMKMVLRVFDGKFGLDLETLTLFMCSANVFTCLLKATGTTVKNSDFLAKPYMEFIKKASFKTAFTEKDAKAFFISTQDEYYAKETLRQTPCKLKNDESTVELAQDVMVIMEKSMEPLKKHTKLEELVTDVNFKTEKSTEDQSQVAQGQVPLKSNRKPTSQAVRQTVASPNHLHQILKGFSDSLEGNDFKGTKDWCDQITSAELKGLDETLGDRIWEWCIVAVKAKLHGRQELFSQCLKKPIPEKIMPKWMNCVEGNLSMLNSSQVMLDWFTMIDKMTRGKHKAMTVSSLRMLGLAAFKKLPLSLQGDVILHVYETLDVKRVFSSQDQLRTKVTSTFNRLVKSQGDSEKSALLITELLLQTPKETFKKIVDAAVHNKGHAKLMAEILKTVPQVCQMKSRALKTLLGCEVYEAVKGNLSQVEERNLLTFLGLLLEKSTPEGDQCLIQPMDVMDYAVFPNLSHEKDAPVPISRTLGILQTVLEKAPGQAWLLESHPVPLAVFLVEMLDSYNVLSDSKLAPHQPGNVLVRASIKEQAISVLEILQQRLLDQHEHIHELIKTQFSEKELTWIYNSLQNCHWTSPFHLLPLFSLADAKGFKKRVPEVLNQCLDLPDEWMLYAVTGVAGFPYFDLFDLLRVSDTAKEMVLQLLKNENKTKPNQVYSHVLSAISMLMPQSVSVEWERMMAGVIAMRKKGLVQSTQHIPHCPGLNVTNVKGAEDELFVAAVLGDLLLVLSESVLSETNPEMNTHIALCYTATLKRMCLRQITLDSYRVDLRMYILTVHFCQLCYQMQLFSSGTAEPLYVLILDILQTYMNSLKDLEEQSPTDEGRKWRENQLTVMKKAVLQCPTEERELITKTLTMEKSEEKNEPKF